MEAWTALCPSCWSSTGPTHRFTVLELSRNFGHQAAITAGLMHADGDVVVFMDGDLQDQPEVIPDLLACVARRCSNRPSPATEPEGKRPSKAGV